ncbi:skeletal muscle fiber development [Halocaridina rubra]|uniref:Skeletal muscle fiber development n=1 Tax=Halocaridina rubra TaxID=373956 RepID=A0AAN8XG28_HALRR
MKWLHAEYQLNNPPRRPLWFTPAAFIGRLMMNTSDMTVQHFSLSVPTDKPLNVDLEWLTGPNEDRDMEVTITYLPKMRLFTEKTDAVDVSWLEEITLDEALVILQKELYRFKKVEYHNFTEAYFRGSSEKMPVHTIVLWGVLDDQSC